MDNKNKMQNEKDLKVENKNSKNSKQVKDSKNAKNADDCKNECR